MCSNDIRIFSDISAKIGQKVPQGSARKNFYHIYANKPFEDISNRKRLVRENCNFKLSLRLEKTVRFEKLLDFAMSHSILTRGLVSETLTVHK